MSRRALGVLRAVHIAVGLAVASASALGADAKIRNFDQEHVPNEFIVKYKSQALHAAASQVIMEENGLVIDKAFRQGSVLLKSDPAKVHGLARDTEAMALEIAQDPNVLYVEANTIIRLSSDIREPNDPSYGEQYALQVIKAPAAWSKSTGSSQVVVGVIDTGIDYNHPDLAANYWTNPGETGLTEDGEDRATNGIDDDGNGYIDDFRGWDFANGDNDPFDDNKHGTHCAGIIGAQGDNEAGIAGVNWNVRLVGLKFLTGGGSGTLAGAIEAVEYATMMGFDLTSNSWGGGGFSEALKEAIEAANERGILFVAAAGNSGNNNDRSPSYPASYDVDNIIAVSATNSEDSMSAWSNYGLTSVDLAAPGVDIFSTVPGDQYLDLSGTSMAAPHVAGAVALVKSYFPELSAAEIKAKILASVDPIEGLQAASGGRLNLEKALQN